MSLTANDISSIARASAYRVFSEESSSRQATTETTGTTPVVIQTIPIADNIAGIITVHVVGFDGSLKVTGAVQAGFKKVSGTLTLGTVSSLLATAADGSFSFTLSASSNNLIVTVTGGSGTFQWLAEHKLYTVFKEAPAL